MSHGYRAAPAHTARDSRAIRTNPTQTRAPGGRSGMTPGSASQSPGPPAGEPLGHHRAAAARLRPLATPERAGPGWRRL
jgi:hypothetical protein